MYLQNIFQIKTKLTQFVFLVYVLLQVNNKEYINIEKRKTEEVVRTRGVIIKDRQGVPAPALHHSQTFSNPVFKITMIYVSSKPRKP